MTVRSLVIICSVSSDNVYQDRTTLHPSALHRTNVNFCRSSPIRSIGSPLGRLNFENRCSRRATTYPASSKAKASMHSQTCIILWRFSFIDRLTSKTHSRSPIEWDIAEPNFGEQPPSIFQPALRSECLSIRPEYLLSSVHYIRRIADGFTFADQYRKNAVRATTGG